MFSYVLKIKNLPELDNYLNQMKDLNLHKHIMYLFHDEVHTAAHIPVHMRLLENYDWWTRAIKTE